MQRKENVTPINPKIAVRSGYTFLLDLIIVLIRWLCMNFDFAGIDWVAAGASQQNTESETGIFV